VDAATLETRWQWRIGWPWGPRTQRPTRAGTPDPRHL
jgi:hypothetical protein